MKYLPLLCSLMLCGITAFGCSSSSTQKNVSEQSITAKVKKTFPKAAIVSSRKDERDGKNVFAIDIKEGDDRRSLVYSETGILLETVQSVRTAQLPVAITKSIQDQYPGGVVFLAQMITRGKIVTYQLAVRSGTRRIEMNLDAKGKTIVR